MPLNPWLSPVCRQLQRITEGLPSRQSGILAMTTSTKILVWLLLSLGMIGADFPASAAGEALKKESDLQRSSIVIALRNDLPPFSFLNIEGGPAGLFVDMWKLWATRTGQTIKFRMGTWKDNLQSLEAGSTDLIGAMLGAEERAPWITLSDPLYEVGVRLHFLKKNGILHVDQLKGERIGVVDQTALQDDLQRDYSDFEIIPFATFEEMIHAARAEEILAFAGTPTLVSMIANRLGLAWEFEASDEILYAKTLHAGARKDHVELLRLVDRGFGAISHGELAAMESVWLPDPATRYFPSRSQRIKLTREEEGWVERHPRVNLAISEGFAPFSFVGQGNEPVGIWADYIELIRTRTGVDLRAAIAAPWETLMQQLQTRAVDGVACTGKTAEREELLAFTDHYMTVPWVIVARDDFQLYSVTLDELSGKTVAVLKTSPVYEILRSHPTVQIIEVSKVEDIWETVSLGRADAGISNLASASYYILRKGITNLKVVGVLKDQLGLGLGIRKDWPELVSILNKAIGVITPDEHNAIQKKWMSVRYEQGVEWSIVRRWIVLIVAGSGIILITAMLLWNRRLTSEIVRRKYSEQALRESESRYRALFELAPDPMAATDLESGRLLDINQAFVDWSGYSYEELIGKTSVELGFWMSPRDRTAMVDRVSTGQSVYGLEAKMCNRAGEVRDGIFSARLTERDDRRELFSIVHDITELKRGEEALTTANKQLVQIIDFLPDATFILNRDGMIIAWNKAMEVLTGFQASEMLGKCDYEYALPFYGERRPVLVDFALRPNPELEKRYTCIRRSGDILSGEAFASHLPSGIRHLSANASVLRDAKGELVAGIQCIRDNTERIEIEEALRESEARYREFFVTSRDAVFITTPEGKWIDFNEAAVELFGFCSREKLEKESVFQRYVDPEERLELLKTIQQTGFAKEYPARLRQKDGTVMETLITAVPVKDPDGRVMSFVGTIRDITRQKQAERALLKSEKKYRDIFEHATEGIYQTTPHGRYLSVNPAFARMFGFASPEEMMSKITDIGRQLYVHPQDREKLKTLLFENGRVERFETQVTRRDGSIMWISINARAVRDEGGELLHFEGTNTDITDLKRADEERRQLEERLQRAEKMEALGTMAGGVAHDLNNVLGIVVGYSELLSDEVDESSTASVHIHEIQEGAERAAAIVQDLLTLARRGVPSRKVLNLNSIVLQYRNSPEFARVLIEHPDIRMKTDLDPDLLNLSGSPVHLGKSLINLILNAAEAMPLGGTLTIQTANCYLDRPLTGYDDVREGDYVVLRVSDTGEGITDSDLKRIFEPFYTKKVMGRSGTGLGLAVVWGTIKDHLGYVNVESEEGKGTTFTLYFPVTREGICGKEVSVSPADYMGNGESILVVDDIPQQRELATKMLTKLHYQVTSVSSGEEAVQYLGQHTVDLVVLDMIMDTGIDGLETYQNMLELHPHQKAVIVSGFAETERVTEAQKLGAGAYVKKPYVLEKLGVAVRRELDRPV